MFVIPEPFRADMIEIHEENGREWLKRLPHVLAECERRWQISILPPFANLSFHYVAPALCKDGSEVVIKACSPTNEFLVESEALQHYGGKGAVTLLDSDSKNEVMLLERLQPGTLLKEVEDDERAMSIAATVMKQMWRPVPSVHPFPSVQDWGKGFARLRTHYDGGHGPFPLQLLERAERLFAELSSSMAEPVLLHGDLHQENILQAGPDEWRAIDPKGLIGEPAYETGALLRNPLPELLLTPHPERILARRIHILAEALDLDRERIRDWGLAQAVLSAWWSVEDSGRIGTDVLTCAELLAQIKF